MIKIAVLDDYQNVFQQIIEIEEYKVNTDKELPVNIMLNVGSPENSFSASLLPNKGVGLARLEFIINNYHLQ